ncbi:AaceriAEL148Wp [[Ashbya] aceris (nom. inval.)]|nr:AaceriAEL148Wp [[Ashbya] aceris (nom. inval.)]
MILKLRRKLMLLLCGLGMLLLCSSLLSQHSSRAVTGQQSAGQAKGWFGNSSTKLGDPVAFYTRVFERLRSAAPQMTEADLKAARGPDCRVKDLEDKLPENGDLGSYEELAKCFKLTQKQLEDLHKQHANFVDDIRRELAISKNSALFKELYPHEQGIVTVGGGRYSILALVMIKALRSRGTTLPVEIFLTDEDADDEEFCLRVKVYNAKCVLFSDRLPKSVLASHKLSGFELKAAALLLSSYQHVMFIDSDNVPLKPLDEVFNSEPYKKYGLILWPDIWKRVTAPAFYEIAGIPVDFKRRVRFSADDVSPPTRYVKPGPVDEAFNRAHVPLHDFDGTIPELTSESGQLLLDKTKHLDTLLLILYYNVYGKRLFYRLSTQATSGEGDKETFAMAARALDKPYYQVKTKLGFQGYHTPDQFVGAALLQHDFVQDYAQWTKARKAAARGDRELTAYNPDYNVQEHFYNSLMRPEKPLDVMFVHASYHKFVPIDLFREKVYLNKDGSQFRSFKDLSAIDNFDVELFAFQALNQAVCSAGTKIEFKYNRDKIKSQQEFDEMCDYVRARMNMLKNTMEASKES